MSAPVAVVMVSGGMDSCVTAAMASRHHELAFLHASYGQRTQARELACFLALADHFGVARRLHVRLDHVAAIGGSSLVDLSLPVPEADPDRKEVPSTYVPFRNGQILSIAAAWAEALGATVLFVGAVEEDSSGYPDCRREFFDAFELAIRAGTRPGASLTIQTPVIHMKKSAIVMRGAELGAPFHLTWSCYRSEEVACGTCDSCRLRLRAFAEAGLLDPIPYGSVHR